MKIAAQWNRNPDGSPVTLRDIEIAALDLDTSTGSLLGMTDRAIAKGECAPDEQTRLDYTWDVVVRRGIGR